MRFPPAHLFAALLLAATLPFAAHGQSASSPWKDVNEQDMLSSMSPQRAAAAKRMLVPKVYRTLSLDLDSMKDRLLAAPPENVGRIEEANVEIQLPLPYGGYGRFMVQDSPIMEKGLAEKYPEFKTYVAQGIDDPTATARIDVTLNGFRAMVLSARGQYFIDPYWRDDTRTYISYYKRNFGRPEKSFRCLIDGKEVDVTKAGQIDRVPPRVNATGATLRTYRAAVAATAEYVSAVSGVYPGTVPQALSAMITTMNRVSAVYERELAVRLVLVANTDLIIYTNVQTDPYSDGDGTPSTLLSQNQTNVTNVIGSANFDIGHVFSTNGGGIATLGCVCNTNSKAQGVTGTTNPVADPYDIDYVAHEMGHQFNAPHTFNTTETSCNPQRTASSAYEPGSGTTIMAYAGICAGQDLADHSDDYFHARTRETIETFITSGGGSSCAVSSATGNNLPVVAALTNRVIPSNTPFALTASATDADGDTLTYCWEEYDLGAATNPATTRDNGSSPIFRSFDPSPSPTRIFPSLTYILNNANVPPLVIATSPLTIVSAETLPTTNRTMTFRVTVRDNRLNGGGANFQAMTVQSIAAAGPFAITAPNTAATFAAGASTTVTWNVAGTTANGINCANVNILLSTDGGLTFPITLASNVANNGSANVTIPNVAQVATTQGRIKVEAVGNVFFDINDANLTITSSNTAPTLNVTGGITVVRGSASATNAVVATASGTGGLTATLGDVPADVAATASIAGGNVSITAQANCTIVTTTISRIYPMKLTVTDGVGSTTSATVNLVIVPNPAPTVGAYANVIVPRSTVSVVTPAAGPADANNPIASPFTVSPTTLPGGGTVAINQTTGAVTVTTNASSTMTTSTIRVTIVDACGASQVRLFTVTVPTAAVALAASTSGTGAPSSESCSPPNGAVDPNETVTLSFPVSNNGGTATTSALTATLQATGGITPVGGNAKVYGVIQGGTSASQPFTFTAAGTCGGTVTATLQLQDGATNYGTVSYILPLGASQTVETPIENFDSVTAPALPAGWTSQVVSGTITNFVSVSSIAAHAGPTYLRAIPVATAAEVALTSPALAIPATGTVQLKFFHRWTTQANNDGVVLETSVNGGAYSDVVTAGGTFVTGGYNSTISTASSVINGRQAWSGSFGGAYQPTVLTLPAGALGQSVRFRWRLVTNSATAAANSVYRLDTISLLTTTVTCTNCASAAPQFTSALPPSPIVVGTPYSHTFVVTGNPAPTFALQSGTLPPGLTLSTGGILSGTPTSAGTGSFPAITVRATNGVNPDADQTFDLNVRTLAANYLSGFGLSGGNAAVTADPNFDGVFNLLAYALGLNPTLPSVQFLPTAAIKDYAGTSYVYLTFNRSSVATDLTYTVEASSDLQTWTTIATSSAGNVTSGPGFVSETGTAPTFTVEVRDVVPVDPVTGAQRLLRLRVSTP